MQRGVGSRMGGRLIVMAAAGRQLGHHSVEHIHRQHGRVRVALLLPCSLRAVLPTLSLHLRLRLLERADERRALHRRHGGGH